MEKLVCENCGGDLVYDVNEPICKCPYCGTSYVVEALLERQRPKIQDVHIEIDGHSIDVSGTNTDIQQEALQVGDPTKIVKTASKIGIIIVAVVFFIIITTVVSIMLVIGSIANTAKQSIDVAFDGINNMTSTDSSNGYSEAKEFSEGLAAVRTNGKWGFIDHKGQFLLSPQYDEVRSFSSGMAAVRSGSRWGFINKTGKLVFTPQFTSVEDFKGSMSWAYKSGGYVLINRDGNILPGVVSYDVKGMSEGMIGCQINNSWQFYDETGKMVFAIKDAHRVSEFSEGLVNAMVMSGNYQNAYYDKQGKQVIRGEWSEGREFHDGLAAVRNKKWGYIDKKGNLFIKDIFDDAKDFNEGMAAVKYQGEWGYVDKTGKLYMPGTIDEARDFSEGYGCVKSGLNDKWGFVDKSGRQITQYEFDEAKDFSSGYAAVEKGSGTESWGFIDRAGRLVIPHKYYEVGSFKEGVAPVKVWAQDVVFITLPN